MTKAKLTGYAIAAVLMGIFTFLGIRLASHTTLYPGDKVETRNCRWCEGTGQDSPANHEEGRPQPSGGACPGCGGAKQVQVIIPGPKHPVDVKGSVRDLSVFKNKEDADEVAMMEMIEKGKTLQPIKGAVPEAKLVFQGPTPLEITSQANGRFRCALEPGEYTLTATAKDFKEFKQTFRVAPLTEPVWKEKAHLETGQKDDETIYLPLLLMR